MHPTLFTIPIGGGLTITSYGVLVATAFVAGIFWVTHEAKRLHEDTGRVLDLLFWIIISAIVGSRVFYVVTVEPQSILSDPLSFFKIWRGGLVFHGGVIGAIIASVIYMRRYKMPFWKYADMFAPAIPLGHVFGRLGCFMSGCCHGRQAPIDSWFSVTFPVNGASFAPGGVPLYPTQLMEAIGELIIFFILFFVRRHRKFEGQLLALYFILYGILRAIVEYFRGEETRSFLFGNFSLAQLVSLGIVVAGILIWVRNRKKYPVEGI